jgi:hypothetical protein
MLTRKILLTGLLAVIAATPLLNSSSYAASTTESVTFKVDMNGYVDNAGSHKLMTAPYIVNGTVMVPLRALVEGLKARVSWDSAKQEVKVTGANFDEITLRINDNKVMNKMGGSFVLREPVANRKGTVFVPARSITQILGAKLKWIGSSRTLIISDNLEPTNAIEHIFSFDKDNQGWEAGFADLPVDYDTNIYELEQSRQLVPLGNNANNYAVKLKGMNRSDDLFMFMTRKIEGLQPNKEYNAKLLIGMYTDQAGGMMGVGGAPGEAVSVKVGVMSKQPKVVVDNANGEPYYRMNIDKGNQTVEGEDAQIVGNITKPDSDLKGYQLVNLTYENKATANEKGELYILIGTDSGYEGLTTLYFDEIKLSLTP